MADHKLFSFSLEGIEAMVDRLERMGDDLDRRLETVLTRLAIKVIHDAKRLAPIDEGDLEAALIVSELKRAITGMYIDIGTSPEVDGYAVVQHEGFRRTKSGTIVEMTPGEKTRSKPSHGGYMPGKKFLENALKMNEDLILQELRSVLEGG
ncbi:HK97 gp10 family phage protein [Paenibacillus lactis]|uniref:Phage protein, HK97 gp10 family n=1 Tax=Paenibacillus lactis 154 TaxID=743719 RepID=G4HNV4_9BACL|nr:HK97 gp10 family phage protein [Paenibacillus lactis]EHB50118.1 phage protein, HK97 gp10 family [Paenibacillus lactis 154]